MMTVHDGKQLFINSRRHHSSMYYIFSYNIVSCLSSQCAGSFEFKSDVTSALLFISKSLYYIHNIFIRKYVTVRTTVVYNSVCVNLNKMNVKYICV